MVLRLFVPPGEGQHRLVPKRPDPIGANATPQYAIISSTVLATAYTSFASRFNQRVTPAQSISRTALFVQSSARLGVCAGLVGAAVNWYYYSAFANVVVSERLPKAKKGKWYKWTKRYTVDDGALAGAALSLAASIPTLFMRRPAIPRLTRCLGMANIGACTGMLGAHGYFHYTGERQKAYRRLDRRLKRRSLEFWAIFWDKELMAKLDPIMQQYVRHNGVWYTQLLPDRVFEQAEQLDRPTVKPTKQITNVEAQPAGQQDDLPFYIEPIDYAADLGRINVDDTWSRINEMQVEKEVLLEEAEYLLFVNAQQQYEYCHMDTMDDDERRRRLQEIHLVEIAYNRLRSAADALDIKMIHWRMSLQHKAAWEKSAVDWLPEPQSIHFASHKPSFSMLEMERMQSQIDSEVKRFEEGCADARYPMDRRERWRKDAEDGRVLLVAADHVLFRMEKARQALDSAAKVVESDHAMAVEDHVALPVKRVDSVHESRSTSDATGPTTENVALKKKVEQAPVDACENSN